MRIAILIEGKTEKAFFPHLRAFISKRIQGPQPKLDPILYDGRIPTQEKLRRVVEILLTDTRRQAAAVIALTDVYTGSGEFKNAQDAKDKMRKWVGSEHRFYPHAAQFDFEAWLLVYWNSIQKLSGHNAGPPHGLPENVDHTKPPAHRIAEVFRSGQRGKRYVKPRDAGRILRDNDLLVSAQACPELKAFLNTILRLSNGTLIP